ncbi:MAG: 3-phosphoserine/phosphohydroxythreonine transaminase [Gammaproteobacteria bacterium]
MSHHRVYNFGPGPAMLPKAVLEQAREELLDWQGTGMSVIEMSHRSKGFISIAEQAEADLRELLSITDDYRVLFLQGGATTQFAMVPLNLLGKNDTADYLHTGQWSGKAIKEAKRFADIHIAASSEADNFSTIPEIETWQISDNAKYLYFTSNETIGGVEFQAYPDSGGIPLVCDATSNFLSRKITLDKYGVIFAGAQKNFGPSGIAVAVVRNDLIGHAREGIPSLYDYAVHRDSNCMYNTPPTFSWYLCGLMFRWIKEQGGVQAMENMAIERSSLMYQLLDESDFYHSPVNPRYRSRMNVPFTLPNEDMEKRFLAEAKEADLVTLEGHRSVGGLRASLYNGMPIEGARALVDFMRDFEKRYG